MSPLRSLLPRNKALCIYSSEDRRPVLTSPVQRSELTDFSAPKEARLDKQRQTQYHRPSTVEMSPTLYTRFRDAVIGHVKAYETPKAFDNEAIQQFRAPECVHYLHPVQSIPEPFNQPIKHQQFVHAMEFFGSAIERLSLDIQDITIDVETRTAVVRILASFDFKGFGEEAAVKDYQADYMWFTEMDDAGKIIRVEEFMDVQRLMGFVKSRTEQYLAFTGQST